MYHVAYTVFVIVPVIVDVNKRRKFVLNVAFEMLFMPNLPNLVPNLLPNLLPNLRNDQFAMF